MTFRRLETPRSLVQARDQLQIAIGVEFGTLPPYLYALFSIPDGANVAAAQLIQSVVMEEMVHMSLACNILNAIGGSPILQPPSYPAELPGHIGPDGSPLVDSLLPFSKKAMQQGMKIEQPEIKPEFPIIEQALLAAPVEVAVSIGQFYTALDAFLATLDESDWHIERNQISDEQFLTGQLFAVNNYSDAHRAISVIVSEGEGAADDPLDFEDEVAHYFRFGEIFYDKVLTKIDADPGYQWGPEPLGVDWTRVFPAIRNPQRHDFSQDPPAAQAAQANCNAAYTAMVVALQKTVTGEPDQLGVAVRAMFDLRLAAKVALGITLADEKHVSGPAFTYVRDPQKVTS